MFTKENLLIHLPLHHSEIWLAHSVPMGLASISIPGEIICFYWDKSAMEEWL